MKVRVVTSEGTLLTERNVTRGSLTIRLTEGQEATVWGESGRRLHQRLDHMDALKSREVHISFDGVPRLRDGTVITDEIWESWGCRKTSDGASWVWTGEYT